MKKLLLLMPAIIVPGIAFAEPAPRIDGGFIVREAFHNCMAQAGYQRR